MKSNKRLLFISYYWPPCGGPGALRPVKFAKYLPHFGINPVILTRKNIAYHSHDPQLAQENTHIKVIKTESLDPARILYRLGMRHYRPRLWQKPLKRVTNFPDNKLPWSPFAYCAGMRMEFDCIFVTAPPFSAFITGYYLAMHKRKPLVLDFRDAWFEFPFLPYKGRMQKGFVAAWEKKVVEAASLIITVDENITEALTGRYPHVVHKITTIPNGYDPDDFVSTKKSSIFTIAHLGTVRKERDPRYVLEAVSELIATGLIKKNEVQVTFIGHVEEPYARSINKYPFTVATGHLPYAHGLHEFTTSHVGLMITTGSSYFFPSRQNEYLASGLPILVCGKSSGVHLITQAFSKGYPGWVYEYDDVRGMKEKILELYNDFKKNRIWKGETPYKELTRKNLTKKLAELIHML